MKDTAEPIRIPFKVENETSLNETFEFMVSDYDPSVPGDMERQTVETNAFNSSTLICVLIDVVDETPTEFDIYIQVRTLNSLACNGIELSKVIVDVSKSFNKTHAKIDAAFINFACNV